MDPNGNTENSNATLPRFFSQGALERTQDSRLEAYDAGTLDDLDVHKLVAKYPNEFAQAEVDMQRKKDKWNGPKEKYFPDTNNPHFQRYLNLDPK